MLQQISIGKRLFAGFGILLAFVAIVAFSGQWGLGTSVDTAMHAMNVDVAISGYANDVNIATLDMRRFEKDYFLNIGNQLCDVRLRANRRWTIGEPDRDADKSSEQQDR